MKFITNEKEFLINEKYNILYFYSTWMPGHKKMILMLSKMEEKYKNINFFGIDVEFFKTLCRKFKIESVPTILLLKDNIEFKRINGLVLTSALKNFFTDI